MIAMLKRIAALGGALLIPVGACHAVLTAGTLAAWDFDDGDLVADSLASGVGAEIGIGKIDDTAGDPTFSFTESGPLEKFGPSLRVDIPNFKVGAAVSITNLSGEPAFLDEVVLTFAGQGTDGVIFLTNDEPLQPPANWIEIEDGILVSASQTSSFTFDAAGFSGSSAGGMELAPGASFSVMLTSQSFSAATIFLESVTFTGSVIPEPSSALLLGAAGLFGLRRHGRR